MTDGKTHEASWWRKDELGRIVCVLCPRECVLGEGQHGFCYIRKNVGGELVSLTYDRPIALHVDPIEKKPLYHFLPGTDVLSLGTAGCNLGCRFCQNWDLTKARENLERTQLLSPEEIVQIAERYASPSIAFTYNEPTIWGEYVMDVSKLAHERGLKTVMVTNGYIGREAFLDIYPHIDAANVDLKAFTEEFYQKLTLSHLQPVLDTLKWLKEEGRTWVEITTLLIPGENDSPEEIRRMCEWMVANLGPDVPLHFTAFHPDYKMNDTEATPIQTLQQARRIALQAGAHFVYSGNVHDLEGQKTSCPDCGTVLIERNWHAVLRHSIEKGACPQCHRPIPGVWG